MDSALKAIVEKINDYVGNLVNISDMSDEDKTDLKAHLLAAEGILLRNGNTKLQEVIGAVTGAVLSRF
jgi:hypothetical protein